MSKYVTQVINDKILEKMSLKNRYSFLNNNLMAALSLEAFNFLKYWRFSSNTTIYYEYGLQATI